MNPQNYDGTDAAIFLSLMETPETGERFMTKDEGLTWPQIRYRRTAAVLFVGGMAAAIGSLYIPWEVLQLIVRELGTASLISGILAAFVEPFFREEFARDAFLAAFRYVLPPEFKEEVNKIIRQEFIAEKQVWTVNIKKLPSGNVCLTTTYERNFKNITKSRKPVSAWYEVEDFDFSDGPTSITGCAIQLESQEPVRTSVDESKGHYRESKTPPGMYLEPDETATVWGEAIQFRRDNDICFETFRTPIKNPEIIVEIDENEFCHVVQFGTAGDRHKTQYKNHYTLSGVYFPGQYMFVRWWPKPKSPAEAAAT